MIIILLMLQVILYRSGLVTAATSFVVASSAVFLPDDFVLTDLLKQNIDIPYSVGAAGLGLSLVLIHIYVTEIKRSLQALWVLGVVGSIATKVCLAQPADESLVQYVVDNPVAVWFIGPLFAALTGLVFKEGNIIIFYESNCDDYIRLFEFLLVNVENRTLLWQVRSWYSDIYYSFGSSRTPGT